MDSKDYSEKALRTDLSSEQYRESENRLLAKDGLLACFLINLMDVLSLEGKNADALKRGLFYGSPTAIPIRYDGTCGCVLQNALVANLALSDQKIRLLHAGLGKVTEAVEFMESVMSILIGTESEMGNLIEENGDALWYDCLAADAIQQILEVNLAEQMKRNIVKLQARYPDKFTEDRALNRNLEAEKEAIVGPVWEEPCEQCGQKPFADVSGEYNCSKCGLATLYDN